MRLGVSTLLFSSHHIVDAVREIARLGHERIELFCELTGLDVDTVEHSTVRRLAELAEEYGLDYSIHPPLVNTAALDEGETGLLLDTGHAVLQHFDVVDCARMWLPRLAQVHAHDNAGEFDDHLPLGEGVIDWSSLIGMLAGAGWDGMFMLELGACDDASGRLADSLDLVAKYGGARREAQGKRTGR